MSSASLTVRGLSVWAHTTGSSHPLVDDISFSIEAGQAVGLVGESGCGKTLTAFAIMGLLPQSGFSVKTAGIEVDGRDISTLNNAQRRALLGHKIAMVFQQPGSALDPVFTLGQQICKVIQRHTHSHKKQARWQMLEALEKVGFQQPETIANAYPHQLSGGMQQLAMIAMATACQPAVLIADEPTTALDPGTTALILEQLKRLQADQQMAVLLISHDLAVVRRTCQNTLVMYCGRVLESTDTEGLFAQPRHPYSAGLLACIPQISTRRPTAIHAIPGQVPKMTDLPGGCHFAPRCERVVTRCRDSIPTLEARARGAVACYRPL